MTNWWRWRLGRLGVVRRLVLLIVVPLGAVAGLAVPVVIGRADAARAAGSVATTAAVDQAAGRLLQQLQRERLLSVVYLATPGVDPLPLLSQAQSVGDEVRQVRDTGDRQLRLALVRLGDLLTTVRSRVLARTLSGAVAHTVFSQAAAMVLTALPSQAIGTASSVRAVRSLDELIRANEEAARAGAAVVVAATESIQGGALLADARTAQRVHSTRFLGLARAEHEHLLAAAETSQAARRVNELADQAPAGPALATRVGQMASAVETYTALRRLVGDRIARDVAGDAAAAAGRARNSALTVGLLAALLIAVVGALAGAGARSIAVPLRELNAAARAVSSATAQELERVRDTEVEAAAPPTLRAVPVSGPRDVANLAAAFNQVQEVAAALLARQVLSRRNTAAMFTTVARRTRNLADRQLDLIDNLERHQQNATLLDQLYRLDHVATRLRRSAAALLVISGAADQAPTPPIRMADIVRAAAAEIEQYTRVRLTDAVDVAAVPHLVPDLILMIAEFLDNAVSFSPPTDAVRVSVASYGAGCQITIVDTGIGMSAEQLITENQRFVERERLDIAPTQVLGLFVIGRLARRNHLEVRLEHTQPAGLTARIGIPGQLLTAPVPGAVAPKPATAARTAATKRVAPVNLTGAAAAAASAIRMVLAAPRFAWFGDPAAAGDAAAAGTPAGARPAAGAADVATTRSEPESRSGLFRRTPGTHRDPEADTDRDPEADTDRDSPAAIDRDPTSERVTADAFNAGFARGVASVPRLVRRRPGAQLDRVLAGDASESDETVPLTPIERDPEAERRTVDRFLVGFNRGVDATATVPLAAVPAASSRPAPHEEHNELERA